MGTPQVRFYHDHVLVKEGQTKQHTPWHQDQPYYNVDGRGVSAWIPVDPVPEDGCLELVAGSHRGPWLMPRTFLLGEARWFPEGSLAELPDIDADRGAFDIRRFSLAPGDAIFFDFLIVHGAPGFPHPVRRRVFVAAVPVRRCPARAPHLAHLAAVRRPGRAVARRGAHGPLAVPGRLVSLTLTGVFGCGRPVHRIGGVAFGKNAISNHTTYPLTFTGLVRTTSLFTPPPGNGAVLPTPRGNLGAMLVPRGGVISYPSTGANCYGVERFTSGLRVVTSKSTGVFAGATGKGADSLMFGAFLPRKNGACNLQGKPVSARDAFSTLDARIALTLRR
jgi:Phytanoyl-CoA dioxygenase (PhyH)